MQGYGTPKRERMADADEPWIREWINGVADDMMREHSYMEVSLRRGELASVSLTEVGATALVVLGLFFRYLRSFLGLPPERHGASLSARRFRLRSPAKRFSPTEELGASGTFGSPSSADSASRLVASVVLVVGVAVGSVVTCSRCSAVKFMISLLGSLMI